MESTVKYRYGYLVLSVLTFGKPKVFPSWPYRDFECLYILF